MCKILPVAFPLWIATTHHVGRNSTASIARHCAAILRPDGHNDSLQWFRCRRAFREASPAWHKCQLVREIALLAGRQTSRWNFIAIKHWWFKLQECDIIVERQDVELLVWNNGADALDFGVVFRDVVTADEDLRVKERDRKSYSSSGMLVCRWLTRISFGKNELTQCAA